MAQLFADAARAMLAAPINDTDTTITIESGGELFPACDYANDDTWFFLVLQDSTGIEVVDVAAHVEGSNTFTVERVADTPRTFALPTVVAIRWTASDAAAATGAGDQISDLESSLATHKMDSENPHGVTAAQVGLSDVDNTADADKPVSTAQQTALNLKANLASPTFTGTVGGLTKAMVGLGSVDNTSDASKPVSTAQQTALNLKANLASPTFTGTVSGITKAMVGLPSVDNVSAASLRDRSTHTGTQAISTVTGLQTALDQVNTKMKQQFIAGTGFTAGTSTTITLTEVPIAPTKDSLQIFFDAGYQQESEWAYNSTTGVITFTSAISVGVEKIEAIWGAALSGEVASAVMGQSDVGTALITAADVGAAQATLGLVGQPELVGSATFTKLTNNIQLTGIRDTLALEIGDVVQISGSASNNNLYTVESITDADNLIVNYEHRNGFGILSLTDETASVTVKRIAKWFNAPIGLGQAWINFPLPNNTFWTNTTQRPVMFLQRSTASVTTSVKLGGAAVMNLTVATSSYNVDNSVILAAGDAGSSTIVAVCHLLV